MSEADKLANQIARQLYAMVSKPKKREPEKGRFTFTDEYPFAKKSRGKFSPVEPEQKESWRRLREK